MLINNYTLINMMNTLDDYGSKRLPQRISYAITKNFLNMQNEYSAYAKSLQNLINKYKEDIVYNDDGKPAVDSTGLPIVGNGSSEAFREELSELLKIETDINIYTVDEKCFDYDDSDKYDAMSANDIITLQSILCNN